jgi:hypothetical protein
VDAGTAKAAVKCPKESAAAAPLNAIGAPPKVAVNVEPAAKPLPEMLTVEPEAPTMGERVIEDWLALPNA